MELKEIKGLLDNLGSDVLQMKETNDARLKIIEKGGSTAELDLKLAKINESITGIESFKTAFEEDQKRKGRPGFGGDNGQDTDYKSNFVDSFMRKGDESVFSTKSGNLGTDADGGFAVPIDVDQNITQLLGKETPMREVCRVIQVGNEGYRKLANIGGAASGWVGEAVARPELGNPKLAQITPLFGELYANPAATQKMLDDAMFNVEDWYAQEIITEFSEQENTAFTIGDGSAKPKGLFAHTMAATADAARAFGTLQVINSGVADNITSDNIVQMVYALRAKYRAGAKFMASTSSIEALRLLKDGQGNYIWRAGLEMGQPSTLAGYGLVENEDVPGIAANAVPIAFGDFARAYTIIDVQGVRTLRDPYTNKPFVQFYTTKRVGGMLEDSNAVKFLKAAL